MDNYTGWGRPCAKDGCVEDAIDGDVFCMWHSIMMDIAAEITQQPPADEIAGDAARLRWGVDVQPPQRPGRE